MNLKLLNKIAISTVFLALTAACVSQVEASNNRIEISGDPNQIQVINGKGSYDTLYRVNGKQFTKADLNASQQKRLNEAENRLREVESKFAREEIQIRAITDRIDANAAQIEDAARKIEEAVAALDLENSSLKDLRLNQAKLDTILREHEKLMRSSEMKMLKAETELVKIDQSLIADIEQQAKEYERILLAIAAEL